MKHIKKRFKKIYIEITNICNLSCEFCLPTTRQNKYMKIDEFNLILDKIKRYTDYIYLHVKGEPLLHPSINELINIAYKKGFNINLTTNGTLFDRLENKNIRQINYSLQSSDNVEEIRKRIQTIKSFIKDTKIYFSIRLWSIKSQDNLEIKQMLVEEFEEINNIQELTDKKKLSNNVYLSIESEFEWPSLKNSNICSKGYCYGLKDQIAILVDGTVVPCCLDNNGDINLGNIYNQNLDEIIESEKSTNIIKGFQNREAVEELCKKCTYKKR